jgi:hypothetical protein
VWPDTFVEEENLTVNISALRKALHRRFHAGRIGGAGTMFCGFPRTRGTRPPIVVAGYARTIARFSARREAKDAYWTEQVDIQWQVASAWVLYAEGKHDDALTENADPVRPQIAEARAFIAKN